MFSITVTAEGQQPERYTFDQAEVSIGRVAGNDIVLKQNNISKRHSRLVVKNGSFILIDLKSTNGTLVNGRKITAPQVVTSADRFSIGDFSLQLDRDSVEGVEVEPDASAAEVPASAPAGIERLEPRARTERGSGSDLFPMDAVPKSGKPTAPAPPPKPTPPPARPTAATPPIPPPTGTNRAIPARTERASAITDGHRSAELDAFAGSAPPPHRRGMAGRGLPAPAVLSRATDSLSLELPEDNDLLLACVGEVVGLWMDEGDDILPPIRPLSSETLREQGTTALRLFETRGGAAPDGVDRDLLLQLVGIELTGLGPVEHYLSEESITEIHVNAWDDVTLRLDGRLVKAPMHFSSARSWERVAERLRDLGQFADGSGGLLRVAGGGRLDLVLPPVAACGPVLAVTKPQRQQKSLDDLVAEGVLHENAATMLRAALQSGASILIAAHVLADASTLFEALLKEHTPHQRLVVVQDVVRESNPAEGTVRLEQNPGAWPSAVARALGLAPTLLGIDPVSDAVVGDWLLGSASRSCSSLLTLPARSTAEALTRLEVLAIEGHHSDGQAVRAQLAAMLDLTVFLARDAEGRPGVTEIAEVAAAEAPTLKAQTVLQCSREEGGAIKATATGHVPGFVNSARDAGLDIDPALFKR